MTLSFDVAFRESILSANEGGYQLSKIDGDKGGWTFAGISRVFWPYWPGWALLDAGESWTSLRLAGLVQNFYFEKFWMKINGENLPPRIAQQVFDMAVNSGPDDAAMCLQCALGMVKVDGDIGPKTCGAVRMADQVRLAMRFNAQRARHYAKSRPLQPGWFNRLADQLERGAI